jgi:predicted nucleic acid-binding protein
MRDRAFVDANICIYAFSQDARRAEPATALLTQNAVISVQVLNEYANVSRRKLRLDWPIIFRDLDIIVSLVGDVRPLTIATHKAGRELAARYVLPFHDSLLLAAALEAGCDRFLSEDLQDGLRIGGLTVVNPFRTSEV